MPSHSYDVLIRLAPQVPAAIVQRAARWTSDSVPSTPAAAASVILLRDGSAGLETYLLHRHARMAFAPSMVVFPGGGLDAADASEEADISGETDYADWSTPDAALAAERSGRILMLPPTISILIELADLPNVAEVIKHAIGRQIEPVLPQWWKPKAVGSSAIRRPVQTRHRHDAFRRFGCNACAAHPSSESRADDPGRNQHLGDRRSR